MTYDRRYPVCTEEPTRREGATFRCFPPARAQHDQALKGVPTHQQIQIQIESLHTRLDEIGEMTSAGGIPAGPFLSTCTMREPRAMLAASHSP